jgi:hypothetical protein
MFVPSFTYEGAQGLQIYEKIYYTEKQLVINIYLSIYQKGGVF